MGTLITCAGIKIQVIFDGRQLFAKGISGTGQGLPPRDGQTTRLTFAGHCRTQFCENLTAVTVKLRGIEQQLNQLNGNLIFQRRRTIGSQRANFRIHAAQQSDYIPVESALLTIQAGDEFAKSLPLCFVRRVGTNPTQTLRNFYQRIERQL